MIYEVSFSDVNYSAKGQSDILKNFTAQIPKGRFVALLGENGAGKTTLLDLLMGFKSPTKGTIQVQGKVPHEDPWQNRQRIAYLSEKMDIPGDWSVKEFLEFNKFFYSNYSIELETVLLKEFRVNIDGRLGSMSAGEIRRVQIVGALATQPHLIIIDEITAVLDIIGRRRFMKRLHEQNKTQECTIILATNILEDLENYISDIVLLHKGKIKAFKSLEEFLSGKEKNKFASLVADALEGE